MRVCLRRGYHHVFDDLVEHPPRGVEYTIPKMTSSRGQSGLINVVKRKGWRFYSNVLRRPNIVKVDCGPGTDLIHSNSGFLVDNDVPWVVDLEHAASFVGFESGKLEGVRGTVQRYLSSSNCRKIMPWTKAGEASIRNSLDTKGFGNKIEVVYPAMAPSKVKRKSGDGINLLFIGYGFYGKGGKEVLEACNRLRGIYDVNLTMVSDVPREFQKKYGHFDFVKPNLTRGELLRKHFSRADVFVLPSYIDTFGMVFLEAMSAGVPIVASNSFAIPEMIEGCGVTVDARKRSMFDRRMLFKTSWDTFNRSAKQDKPEVVDGLVEKISFMIDNPSARNRMSRRGRLEVSRGKFSVGQRNKKLNRIYEESLRR